MHIPTRLKVIHVDDDPTSINYLRKQLEPLANIEYVGSFVSATDALEFLKANEVDLVFTDIEMPENNGLWLAKQIQHLDVYIVFLTAHTKYAIYAFEVCALDYLQKPIQASHIKNLIDKIEKKAQEENYHNCTLDKLSEQIAALTTFLNPQKAPDTIFINMIGYVKMIRLEEVIHFSSTNNYTTVILINGERPVVSKTIKTFEEALQNNRDFLRVSRSSIINKNFINIIRRNGKTRRINIAMTNGDELETSYRTKEEIIESLNK